ncbi:class I SAM-dependent methyltransferase [Spirulina subsalsa]|uniref:class I SAM-dependent methyltransferase n=1 Tax=Spirulina subsalsa TaxID=54311 RepID=UPI000371805A|nr:class I SAM-dependent methyltransferase [Spirulina subsalsa]
MATILRDWSYRYQWLYDSISWLAAIAVGGETRFRQLALQGLTLEKNTKVLDLCCGAGPVTEYLVRFSDQVTGLDASPNAIKRASQRVPQAQYVEAFAERMPFEDQTFDVVHTSAALHEMKPEQLRAILGEVYRVLKPNGVFTLVDFHQPTNPLFFPGVALFLGLFETETAWQLLKTDLVGELKQVGFRKCDRTLHAGGSLQVIQSYV